MEVSIDGVFGDTIIIVGKEHVYILDEVLWDGFLSTKAFFFYTDYKK